MRVLIVKDKILTEVATGAAVECWHERGRPCSTDCAAQHMVSQTPDGQNQVFVCAALAQPLPVGIPEPSRIAMPSGLVGLP